MLRHGQSGARVAAVLWVVLAVAACGTTIKETMDDATITTRVKTRS
jgi:hypothetical protein